MNTGFTEKDYTGFDASPADKVVAFLNDLRDCLNKHKVKLYGQDCEVYIDGQGYIGYLEDNVETVEITEGEETLYSSYKSLESSSS